MKTVIGNSHNQRERERETERQRETETETDRETERVRERQREVMRVKFVAEGTDPFLCAVNGSHSLQSSGYGQVLLLYLPVYPHLVRLIQAGKEWKQQVRYFNIEDSVPVGLQQVN